MLLFNFIVFSVSLWIILFLNSKYLRPALINKERFKLFALRDELSILAMRNDISQKSTEYKTLMKLLNNSISVLETFSIVEFLEYLSELHNNKKIQEEIDEIVTSLDHNDSSYKKLVHDYFKTMHIMLDKHTRFLRKVVFPILFFFFTLFAFVGRGALQKIQQKSNLITEIDSDFTNKLDLMNSCSY